MARISVSALPKDPGPAGWNRILPEPARPTPLEGNVTADWLVIGAGFAGLAAARQLSLRCGDDKIVVLDATRVGDGPAGRNSGFMIDLPHDLSSSSYGGDPTANQLEIQDNREGITFARETVEAFGLGPEAFDPCGKINAAATERGLAQNQTYASHIRGMGESCQDIDAQEMREITGSDYYLGGLFTPGVAVIQPAAYVRSVAQGLKSNRVTICENSPVTRLERTGDWTATTPTGQVTAPRVILAVNGHLNSFGFLKSRLLHVFTYASMTRALTKEETAQLGGRTTWGITSADPLGSSVRKIEGPDGIRIVVRNRFTCDPSMEIDGRRIKAVAKDHVAAFAARFPKLHDVSMEHCWGGRLCLSTNNVQVVGELEPGLFAAGCQNGLGTVKGTLAGKLAADLATGHPSDALNRAMNADAPRRLPPRLVTKIGANARIRWGEKKAGREL